MLRQYQQESVDAVIEYCKATKGNPLVVLPTGSGKSHCIAAVAEKAHRMRPNMQIIILAHRKELIQQNAKKFSSEIDVGIYHAGIGSRDTGNRIILAGIQSIANSLDEFKDVGLVIVDECHCVSFNKDTQYRKVLEHFGCRVIGYTATPYRLDGGMLHVGANALFHDVVYEKPIREMIPEYLSPIISKMSKIQPNLKGARTVAGDYNKSDIDEIMSETGIVQDTCFSIMNIAIEQNRKKWLIFCVSIEHAQKVGDILRWNDIVAEVITGKTPKAERANILSEFSLGRITCLINIDVLTTGFDEPSIDLIAMLRPTQSTGLYVQMTGRGLRQAPNKENCLILDYARNIKQHGPIDKLRINVNSKKAKDGDDDLEEFDAKICPVCETVNDLDAKTCFDCGHLFAEDRKVTHETEPDDEDINFQFKEPEWIEVNGMEFSRNKGKEGKKDTLKVTFDCMFNKFNAWLCVEHEFGSWARIQADRLLAEFNMLGIDDIDLCLKTYQQIAIPPTHIKVDFNEKYPQIKEYRFNEK